ncbi:MAG: MscL family protein [Candidatus Spechtbacterales bacterium]
MRGFLDFIREQGVVGLAVGFVLGGSVSGVVNSLVSNIINPLVGIVLPNAESLQGASLQVKGSTVGWGAFVSVLIDFLIIALVVYAAVKLLRVEKLDKKKEKK